MKQCKFSICDYALEDAEGVSWVNSFLEPEVPEWRMCMFKQLGFRNPSVP